MQSMHKNECGMEAKQCWKDPGSDVSLTSGSMTSDAITGSCKESSLLKNENISLQKMENDEF